MKDTDYIVIQAQMVTELGLSGNRLLIYALIHGFSKDGVHEFRGSINYICEWTNLTRNTVISVLKSLVDDGLITKREYIENNVKFCAYQIRGSAKIALPVQSTTSKREDTTNLGSAKIAPNNNIYSNTLFSSDNIDSNNKDNNISCPKSEKWDKSRYDEMIEERQAIDKLFEICWKEYRRKGRKKQAKAQWNKLTIDEMKIVKLHIAAYISEREIQYQQDFERYLRDKTFNSIVYGKGNKILFDPTDKEDSLQTPQCQEQDEVVIGGQTYK